MLKNSLQKLNQFATWLAQYRLRTLFRSVFLLLALATLALAGFVLQQEKQLSYRNYQTSFGKTQQQMLATLRHPTGQLALLNPPPSITNTSLRPLLLPFAALDFDDQIKVQQAIALSDCMLQYGNQGALCAGIGSSPWAGAFIYVAGNFNSEDLLARERGDAELQHAHRLRVKISVNDEVYDWLAPFELERPIQAKVEQGVRGRLTGFTFKEQGYHNARPVKDFRGWLWQSPACAPSLETTPALPQKPTSGVNGADDKAAKLTCPKNSFFSLRLPIRIWQEEMYAAKERPWPPAGFEKVRISVQVLPPNSEVALLDSNSPVSARPFSLHDLQSMLLPGERLQIKNLNNGEMIFQLQGELPQEDASWRFLGELIRQLPVQAYDTPLVQRAMIHTALAQYELELTGDIRSVNQSLASVASRIAWFVAAMLTALLLAWLMIELSLIRRISILSRRAKALSKTVQAANGIAQFEVADLRNGDELGLLAGCLHDLLRRVKEDVEREEIRAEQEKQMWHAVGHEIMSPLQSLMVLHGAPDDPSQRYIHRMQQALRVLYGSASPSEAFQSTVLQVGALELVEFLRNVAANASFIGIEQVAFVTDLQRLLVRADEYSLEDVVTHVLRNAERLRHPGSPITIHLLHSDKGASIAIHNQGPQIAEEMLEKIFEYGVSDQAEAGANGNRGQGLFVAKTYMAKMGGTIQAHNVANGVEFVLGLQRGAA